MPKDSSANEELISKAEKIARAAHAGQVDKLGVDYFAHVAAVADAVSEFGTLHQVVALLHDSLEDCEDRSIVSLDLLSETFGEEVAAAVNALTKRQDEDYEGGYLQRVMANPIALTVKKADLAHNRSRLHFLPEKLRHRLTQKYDRVESLISQPVVPD